MTDLINWLTATWNDFINWIGDLLALILQWFTDVFLTIFELVLDGVVYVFGLLEPPDFVVGGLGNLFSALPNDIAYFLGQSGIAAGLAVFGAGVAFRLLRKLFTLGQW